MPARPPTATLELSKERDENSSRLKANKESNYFKLRVNNEGKTWSVSYKYSDFALLNEKLSGTYPATSLPLPGKRGLFTAADAKFLEKRRQGLDRFVQAILVDTRLLQSPLVREFFQLDNNDDDDDGRPEVDGDAGPVSTALAQMDVTDRVNLGPSERTSARPSDFDYLKTIGKGSFGKVYLAVHKAEGKAYAVKVLGKAHIKKRNEVRHIMSERNVLVINVKHPFLVGLQYSFQTRDKLYFVLDYVNGGELFYHLQREKRFPEKRAQFYAAEIGSALGYLHEKKIIYRDLKPENLLISDEGHMVLTDFGLCKEGMEQKQTTNTFCGTPEYLAPEVIQRQPYDRTVDWWCLGSVLYEMMFGLPPFYSRDHKEMYDRIVNQPLKVSNVVSAQAKDVLHCMLHKDRTKRLGAKHDFADIQAHPFFASLNFEQLLAKQIPPPYIPKVQQETDTTYVDSEFLKEPISASVGRSYDPSQSYRGPNGEFSGFTYVQAGALAAINE